MGLILSALGWQPIEPETESELNSHPRLVMLYPHTSYFDFFLYLLYRNTSPSLGTKCKVLINPYWMDIFGAILEPLGGMRATRREDSGGGVVSKIVDQLKGRDFIFLVSPKGCRDRHHWRSGYYQVALQTQAKIVCAGFDYHQHRFVMCEPFDPSTMTLSEVETRCKREMASMTPMNLEWAEYPLRAHLMPLNTSMVNDEQMPLLLSLLLSLLLVLVMIAQKMK